MSAFWRNLTAAALGVFFLVHMAAGAEAQKRVALVIGNSAYTSVGALPNPANDAKLVKTGLEGAGFSVTLAESLGREALDRKSTRLNSSH